MSKLQYQSQLTREQLVNREISWSLIEQIAIIRCNTNCLIMNVKLQALTSVISSSYHFSNIFRTDWALDIDLWGTVFPGIDGDHSHMCTQYLPPVFWFTELHIHRAQSPVWLKLSLSDFRRTSPSSRCISKSFYYDSEIICVQMWSIAIYWRGIRLSVFSVT